ncbi:MAG: ammonium transporter [Ruminococcus sp.]|uniref:Ammonium transporter n=2 Tax=Oscillospiraceae TaxID=216572 RepID=A0A934U4C2_9FIRM|nr:ammonium transporter [uncultured Ruminococcus sp.]MBK6088389.1 ammonium transporter [Ruminococcus difficilis]MBQ1587237.1 ammonium transporter [Ruminococcus sp.]MBQ1717506.1 ammonium transporter [Ruminococcus sp.]MBQ1830322.1 ammonium transporter [Ruminococcus sp.]MBQ2279750.1 ammonium transporter [Ruminococcus sp.]
MNESIREFVTQLTNEQLFAVWFLIGAALVFWMQAGFAMVEAGFTRAKNTGNIIMKNLMDFCIGTVTFILIGFGLLMGEDLVGIIGKPGFDLFTSYANFNFSSFVFNLVFCATTATIVSGAMAERTKFLSYCVYSGVISAVIYPIEAHWIWGGGWLSQIGFHDFAGSCAIHMVGGISALIGAKILGARIGKFKRDKNGKVVKVGAFPGHNIALGALGVFILWLGWYGFNGAAATSVEQLGSIFLTTTIAPAVATVACMIFTWIKYGKPDVSMCLNASLAGLVAITAPCDVTDAFGAIVIGLVAGLLVVFGVWLLDYKLHIDDPVGAVAVHMMNGIWGTLSVGLFATDSAPGYAIANASGQKLVGLFYGGGFELMGLQLIGFASVAAWTAVTITVVFLIIKKIFGLRVTREEEITGLDATEHGMPSAYAGFSMLPDYIDEGETPIVVSGDVPVAEAVAVKKMPSFDDGTPKITKVEIVCKEARLESLKNAMMGIGITGMTVSHVLGCGAQKGKPEYYRGVQIEANLLPKVQVDVVVCTVPVTLVIETAKKVLYTGHIGDGKIFVYDVEDVVKVRTGETGIDAMKNFD